MVVADDTAAAVWVWITSNIGAIATIILMGSAITRYLEKRSEDKIEAAKKFVFTNIDGKFESMSKDIAYINKDIEEIKIMLREEIRTTRIERERSEDRDYRRSG